MLKVETRGKIPTFWDLAERERVRFSDKNLVLDKKSKKRDKELKRETMQKIHKMEKKYEKVVEYFRRGPIVEKDFNKG